MKHFLLIFLNTFSVSTYAQKANDCVFDDTWLNESILNKNTLIQTYKWDDQKKTGYGISKNGDFILFKGLKCFQSGMDITLIKDVSTTQLNVQDLAELIKAISDTFMTNVNNKLILSQLAQCLSVKNWQNFQDKGDFRYNVMGRDYAEFFVEFSRKDGFLFVRLCYYMN